TELRHALDGWQVSWRRNRSRYTEHIESQGASKRAMAADDQRRRGDESRAAPGRECKRIGKGKRSGVLEDATGEHEGAGAQRTAAAHLQNPGLDGCGSRPSIGREQRSRSVTSLGYPAGAAELLGYGYHAARVE